jgi:hypothetical protein
VDEHASARRRALAQAHKGHQGYGWSVASRLADECNQRDISHRQNPYAPGLSEIGSGFAMRRADVEIALVA